MDKKAISSFLLNTKFLLTVYIIIAIVAGLQLYMLGKSTFNAPVNKLYTTDIMAQPAIRSQYMGKQYTQYNNYVVFKRSYFHLLNGEDLYTIYPEEQWDLYKYSPSFPVFMLPFAYLPDVVGLALWNILNALVLFFAIRMLPVSDRARNGMLWFVLLELLTSLQSAQSNALLAGLIIMAYALLHKRKIGMAVLMLVLATIIKPYGAIGFCMFLFYPGKGKAILYSILWGAVVLALPLVLTTITQLTAQYHSWAQLIAADKSSSYGLSVMGWLHSWFGLSNINMYVMMAGILLFLLVLSRIGLYKNTTYQLYTLALMLMWIIIFNYKAESPTFIIAIAGAAIWYFPQAKATWRTVMIITVFIGSCLTPTDIFPPYVRQHLFNPYVVKAIPCIVLWFVIFIEVMLMHRPPTSNKTDRKVIG
ncbi:MAG: DUF2029 domain-containing protein [Taibaiella sp.]|nr:DUF2029 domain-containing protein [Taibaiella sp.]